MSESEPAGVDQEQFLQELLSTARHRIEQVFRGEAGVSRGDEARIRQLATGLPTDHRVTTLLGALASAIIELGPQADPAAARLPSDVDALASELVRLAYNRWQRERRAGNRIRHQAEVGERVPEFGGDSQDPRALDSQPTSSAPPEIHAHFRDVVDHLMGQLSEGDLRILVLFAEGRTLGEIASLVDCHRTTISRKLDHFADIVRRVSAKD
ncbi:MAG TPA: helix-turn-helix domain-containing protein [Pirellulaceae bacterium]|nr:helix-turn-helix domain-containing protein [Pirellulaceae bacterium]